MHAPLNGVDTTPVILILAIPLRRIHPTITPHHLVTICCVICRLFHEIYPIHANTPKFTYILIRHITYNSSTASPPFRSKLMVPDDILI